MYLVDTNVVSAGTHAARHHTLVDWMDRNSGRIYISTITVTEIEDGIAKLRRTGSTSRAAGIAEWLEALLHLYADRILAFDITASRITGAFSDYARSKGQNPGFADLAIAGTAKAHALTLLTRNVKHFAAFDITVHDPFKSLPQ